jgi:glycosyltransferase involved in cell wall biosynthesis
MNPPYLILFVTSNLGGGGAERALVNVINHLDRTRFTPHLALFQKKGVFLPALAPDVAVYEIQPTDRGFIHRNWVRLRALNQLCEHIQPALVMSIKWQANEATILSLRPWKNKIPVIINEQDTPRASTDQRRKIIWPLVKGFYRLADHLIVITQGIANELVDEIHIPASKITVIYNPVDLTLIAQQAQSTVEFKAPGVPAIIAAGRLVQQKNYPLLFTAAARVLQSHEVEIYILGEGPEKEHLQSLAIKLGISEHVHFLGFVPNPFSHIAQGDIFTLTSVHEGFGNVIVEAMACGTPVISTDCPYGPREILSDGKYGLIVASQDEIALTGAILDLLDHPLKRQQLSQLGRQRAIDFSIDKIISLYEQTFLNTINDHSQ